MKELVPDLSLLKKESMEFIQSIKPLEPGNISLFSKGNYKLYYINAEHVHDPSSTTFQAIRAAFETYHISAVITESEKGKCFLSEDPSGYNSGEAYYAADLAKDRDIPVLGGEPDYKAIIRGIVQMGYKPEDHFGLKVMSFAAWKNYECTMDITTFPEVAKQALEETAQKAGLEGTKHEMSYNSFKDWYKRNYHNDFKPEQIERNDIWPYESPSASIAQRISCDSTDARDIEIIKVITHCLNKYKSVLIVYGSTHREAQLDVLEKMLSKCQILPLSSKRPNQVSKAEKAIIPKNE